VAARRAVAANLFTGAALYVNPDYAKNAASSLAKVLAGGPDAQRIKVVQVRPPPIIRLTPALRQQPLHSFSIA
jgi:cellulase/cellobiase CelA1